MFWWINYAPQFNGWDLRWPWSGWTQDIAAGLMTQAGTGGRVERRVLQEVASYGRQLGVLSELVEALAKELPEHRLTPQLAHAQRQLADFNARIEAIKSEEQVRPLLR